MVPIGGGQGYAEKADARVGADWKFGRWSLHAAATTRSGGDLYTFAHSSRTTFLVGASYAM